LGPYLLVALSRALRFSVPRPYRHVPAEPRTRRQRAVRFAPVERTRLYTPWDNKPFAGQLTHTAPKNSNICPNASYFRRKKVACLIFFCPDSMSLNCGRARWDLNHGHFAPTSLVHCFKSLCSLAQFFASSAMGFEPMTSGSGTPHSIRTELRALRGVEPDNAKGLLCATTLCYSSKSSPPRVPLTSPFSSSIGPLPTKLYPSSMR
jgi:hypothetical protein